MKKLGLMVLLMMLVSGAWALPPQAEADRLMIQTKALMDSRDYAAAVQNFARMESLGVRLPPTFNYHYGVALAGIGEWEKARQKLDRYITDGDQKFYKEALEKYNEVEPEAKQFFRDCPACPEMVAIPGKRYALGKYEVTQKEWRDIMGNNPSRFQSCGDTCPVEQVSWNDIQEFLQKLNAKTGKQYRLPTEAEWEYACHGDSPATYCGGHDIDALAWYHGNSNKTTHPVGQKRASNYGLYDMSGNVDEWMQDWYDSRQRGRVLRGGSWYSVSLIARAAYRTNIGPAIRAELFGFRLARTLP